MIQTVIFLHSIIGLYKRTPEVFCDEQQLIEAIQGTTTSIYTGIGGGGGGGGGGSPHLQQNLLVKNLSVKGKNLLATATVDPR